MTALSVWVWVFLAVRTIPVPYGDQGIFASVAERLLSGDRLYVDVWDNKDPFFYYTIAVARTASPLGWWALELAWYVVASMAAVVIVRAIGGSLRTTVLAGVVITPMILLGLNYPAGGSFLPAVALGLMALALVSRGRVMLGGLMVGSTFLFKALEFPLVVIVVGALTWSLYRSRGIARLLLGVAISFLCGIALMGLRGELGAYMGAFVLNAGYAQSGSGSGVLSTALSRLQLAFSTPILIAFFTTALVIFGVLALRHGDSVASARRVQALAWGALTSLIAFVAIMGAMAKWSGHAGGLSFLTVLAGLVAVTVGPANFRSPTFFGVVSALTLGVMLAGVPPVTTLLTPIEYARANISANFRHTEETNALLATGSPASWARVGTGEEGGHAFGLREWALACPRFHQYQWESEAILTPTLDCLPKSHFLIVDDSAVRPFDGSAYDSFVAGVEDLLESRYACESLSGFRLCERTIADP